MGDHPHAGRRNSPPAPARAATKRTMFAVGDDKQSIFSFQGAAPEKFGEMKDGLRARLQGGASSNGATSSCSPRSGRARSCCRLSMRCSRARPPIDALSSDKTKTVHEALPDKLPGPCRHLAAGAAETKARHRRLGCAIRHVRAKPVRRCGWRKRSPRMSAIWQRTGDQTGRRAHSGAPARPAVRGDHPRAQGGRHPGRRRRPHGADRPYRGDGPDRAGRCAAAARGRSRARVGAEEPAVRPERGRPVRNRAWNRGRHVAARGAARQGERIRRRRRTAEGVSANAALRDSPFTFYARLLGAGGARKRILARLGPEANDALDEFLNLALDYERRETPSLQGFVAWLRAANAEVKRDMEITRDEVRVMTVHGAKGLEAHTVILADTTTRPQGYRPPRTPRRARLQAARVWSGRSPRIPIRR